MYCLMYPMYSKTLQTLHHTGYIDNHEQKSILCIWQFRFLCFSQGWFKIDHTSGLVIAFTYPRPGFGSWSWRSIEETKILKKNISEWPVKYDNAVNLVDSLILPGKRPSFFSISWRLPKSAHCSTSLKDDPTYRACHRYHRWRRRRFFTSTEFVVRRRADGTEVHIKKMSSVAFSAENERSDSWFL